MTRTGYRYDIDGLRAIAVLLVVIFHINEALIPGGFVGVDMFFVISGFLITGNIVHEHKTGTFSYREFYRRRIRRILPAMFLVTLATVVAGTLLLLPEDVETLAWSAIATAASGANVYFTYFQDTSYFAADSATIPLLHMWSLGVEEQFYLIWPITLLLLLRRGTTVALLGIAAMIAASIAIGEWQIRAELTQWAYYMLPSRAFQLAAGGALVFLPQLGRLASAILAPAGLAAVAWSAYALEGSSSFPGLNAVPVTAGTAALLIAGTQRNAVSSALSLAPLRAIGLISYSLYLWHWPVLAFQRYFYGELSPVQQMVSFAVMLGLAVLSYRFVELPFRSSRAPFPQVLAKFALAPTALVAALCFGLIVTNGYGPYRWTDYPERLAAIPSAAAASTLPYVCQSSRLTIEDITNSDCVLGDSPEPRVLLYGDSHAAHHIGVVGEIAKAAGVSFRNYEHSSCIPLDRDPKLYVSPDRLASCRKSHDTVHDDLENYDIIFIGASWEYYRRNAINNNADLRSALRDFNYRLTLHGTRVILLDTVPRQAGFDPKCGQRALKFELRDCADQGVQERDGAFTLDLIQIAAEVPNTHFMSIRKNICSHGKCPTHDANGISLYFDGGHLSAAGSWRIGEQYIQTDQGRDVVNILLSTFQ